MLASRKFHASLLAACVAVCTTHGKAASFDPNKAPKRNVILFVADGLRPGSVNATDAPTLFQSFTTANASAMATGHLLGETGDFSNTIFTGYPL